jgi:hypothetical protein
VVGVKVGEDDLDDVGRPVAERLHRGQTAGAEPGTPVSIRVSPWLACHT